jgi:hypothetical protein
VCFDPGQNFLLEERFGDIIDSAGRLLYVDDRHATDGSVNGYELVDVTLSDTDLFLRGLSLRVEVMNIFDHSFVYTTQRPIGMSRDEIPGRTWLLRVAYDY